MKKGKEREFYRNGNCNIMKYFYFRVKYVYKKLKLFFYVVYWYIMIMLYFI